MNQGRQNREPIPSGDALVTPGGDAKESFQLTMLRAFLLPPACRDVFVLKEIQGYTLPEVAAVLGISKDDVTKHLRRAQREMQTS
ncbi:MAG TPA: sigma factor-like helix-turn-helix DNA-binding protein [Terriglobales bacterium]|nr:sigma factor-like helix-turn-helix DNA-binding protein [Terriglobales bacterium]